MKRLFIIILIVLLLAGGGVAAAYFFVPGLLGIQKEQPKTEEPKPAPKPKLIKPLTKRLSTIDVPLVLDGNIDRHIYFDVTLIVAPEHYAEVDTLAPRLRSAFIQYAFAIFPKQYEEHGRMDLPKLRISLRKIAQETLGSDVISDVVLQSYFER